MAQPVNNGRVVNRDLHIRSLFGLSRELAFNALPSKKTLPNDEEAHVMSEAERSRLSRNDAQVDAQTAIEEEPTAESDEVAGTQTHAGEAKWLKYKL